MYIQVVEQAYYVDLQMISIAENPAVQWANLCMDLLLVGRCRRFAKFAFADDESLNFW